MQESSARDLSGDLVVDTRAYADVEAALRARKVLPSEPDVTSSPGLGLVLVRTLRLEAYAESAAERFRNEVAAVSGVEVGRASGLDYLLYDLRREFGDRVGSVPVLARNRDAVIGYPQHKALKFPSPEHDEFPAPSGSAGAGVTVGVVDTAPARHPLLPAELVDTDAWFEPEGPVSPWAGHGTFVAGLVRRQAPAARLRMRAGLASDAGTATCWDVAEAIAGFRGSGVAVLNLSFGCVTADDAPPLLLERALSRLDDEVLVVAAAGNRGLDEAPPAYVWPGAGTAVRAVGAAAEGDDKSFSMQRPWVDVVAGGVLVTSTFLDGDVTPPQADGGSGEPVRFDGFARWSGTSFAAATVTGKVAARMAESGRTAREALDLLLDEAPRSGVARFPGKG